MKIKIIFAVFMILPILFFNNIALSQDISSGLKINDIIKGEGDEAILHSQVLVHYTGWLMDGTKFDSSLDRDQPFQFTIGTGQVIAGWEIGIGGMLVGGKRELIIPPELAYGKRGAGDDIPADSTLKFNVELIAVIPPLYKKIMVDDMASLMDKGAKIIDIRNIKAAKKTGVIEGAKIITAFNKKMEFKQSFVAKFQKSINVEDIVILIGEMERATLSLAHIISSQGGYKNIYMLEGGMKTWLDKKMPVVAAPKQITP